MRRIAQILAALLLMAGCDCAWAQIPREGFNLMFWASQAAGSTSYAYADLTGLRARWPLSADLNDASGNGYALSDGGVSVVFTNRLGVLCKAPGSYPFNNAIATNMATYTSATFSVWISLPAESPAANGLFFKCTANGQDSWYVYSSGDGYFNEFLNSRIGPIAMRAGVSRTNWNNIVVTTTPGASGWKIYQNGVQVTTTTGATNALAGSVVQFPGSSVNWYSEATLWGRAWPSNECLQNFNNWKGNYGQ